MISHIKHITLIDGVCEDGAEEDFWENFIMSFKIFGSLQINK